ncbi:hypothetical protein GPECTOR_10g1130 [Gonium pectorale]|uniref:Uncharacterized protein n=1 Tax=Gonium pectorale TaxID=33097 RepID=A0A150GQI7_GONPE|nr:hypothetical protein GPECTOR_10g1130 [Gonium pectorale]|eukprot:KXZ52107.1 hypothetical protein GPECTOR_10g1130 [Gonium pectorale]
MTLVCIRVLNNFDLTLRLLARAAVDRRRESEDELLRAEVASLVPEMRLTLATNMGSLLTLAAFVTSWLTGEDPLGGFAMTSSSLGAMAQGAGYAIPLVLCSLAARLKPVQQSFPVLGDLHDSQREIVHPIVQDLNSSQLLILASVLVVPTMLLLLPAAHGAMSMAGALLASDLVNPSMELAAGPGPAADVPLPLQWHWHVPGLVRRHAGALATAVCSGYFAAWFVTRQLDVSERQVVVIREAFESADRYFLHAAAERAAERPDLLRRSGGDTAAAATAAAAQARRGQATRSRLAEAADGVAVTSFAAYGGAAVYGGDLAMDDNGGGDAANAPLRQLGTEMAQAFKTVSILWLLTRRRAARLAYVLTALNVSYFGIIWHHTNDLGAPVTAALLATLAELLLIKHLPHRARG